MTPPKSRLARLVAELKRRRVFRVVSIYLVAAWLAIQVTATVVPALPILPSWTVTAVIIAAAIGFPFAIILGWAFDITEEGVERTGEGDVYRARWVKPAFAALVVLVVVGAGAALYWRARHGDELNPATPIAVMPFTVQGGPTLLYLSDGMVDLLSAKLDGVAALRSISPSAILKALGPKAKKELSPADAEPIARGFGARYYILGSIVDQGGALSVGAQLYEVGNREPIEQALQPGARDSVLTLVDRIAAELLVKRFKGPASRMIRAAALTTNSLPALSAYLQGESAYRSSQFQSATDWFNRALQADSTFALAGYRAATAAVWGGLFDAAKNGIRVAQTNRERLSARDQTLVDAFAAFLHGDARTAERLYSTATREHPEDYEAWYWLAESLYHYNQFRGGVRRAAKPYFEKAARIAPNEPVLKLHLLDIALEEGDFKTFDRLTAGLDPNDYEVRTRLLIRRFATRNQKEIDAALKELEGAIEGTLIDTSVGLAELLYDVDNAERVASLLTGPTHNWVAQGVGNILLADLDVVRGRWVHARQNLEPLRKLYSPPVREAEGLYAALPTLNVSPAELQVLRGQLQQWAADSAKPLPMPPSYLGAHEKAHAYLRNYMVGLLSARLRDVAAVESSARMLASARDSVAQKGLPAQLATGLRAQAAFVRGDYDAVIDSLSPFPPTADYDFVYNSAFFAHAHERLLVAQALEARKRFREAHDWYESLSTTRADLYMLGEALLGRARTEDALGRKQSAIHHYQAFVDLWRNCDPPLRPTLQQAQQRLKELKGK